MGWTGPATWGPAWPAPYGGIRPSGRQRRPVNVQSAHIGIIELGRVGCGALLRLMQHGVRNFALADTRPVLAADIVDSPLFGWEDLGRARAEVALARLQTWGPRTHLEVRPGPEAGFAWDFAWLGECDACVLAADVYAPQYAFAVNVACLMHGVPLLPGLLMGVVGQLGPLVRSGGSPCLRCADLRILTTSKRPSYPAPMLPDPAVAGRVGWALADEVARLITTPEQLTTNGILHYLWSNGAATQHPVLRTTRCPDCAALPPFLPLRSPTELVYQDQPPADARRILGVQNRLVDPVTGLIRTLQRAEVSADDPSVPQWVATVADIGWTSFGTDAVYCGGTDLSEEAALAAALGEAVERSAACQPGYGDMRVATYGDVAADAIDPLAWDVFHPLTRQQAGFPYLAPAHEQPVSWVWGYALGERRPVLAPAARVFVPFRPLVPGDQTDVPTLSGFSTGNTLEEATLGAVLEVLERDAFMLAWANRLPMQRLEIDRLSADDVGAYVAAFEDRGLQVRCSAIRLDLGSHLVVAMARASKPNEPATVIATAADLDLTSACRRALKELVANRQYIRHEMLRAQGRFPPPDPALIIDQAAHGLLYARPDMVGPLDPWWEPAGSVPLPPAAPATSPWSRLFCCIGAIAQAGLQVFVVDLTPPEIKELGLWTVKALIPGTYPMNFDSRWPHFGGVRMRNAPVAAGLRADAVPFEELNRVPHPFP